MTTLDEHLVYVVFLLAEMCHAKCVGGLATRSRRRGDARSERDAATPSACRPPAPAAVVRMDDETIPEEAIPNIRVLIWDLDESFWSGTLDDAGPPPRPIAQHCALVKSLAARGVVSSICSRNDPTAVRAHLQCLGMWEWFVFASVSWEMPSKPKPKPNPNPNQVQAF